MGRSEQLKKLVLAGLFAALFLLVSVYYEFRCPRLLGGHLFILVIF